MSSNNHSPEESTEKACIIIAAYNEEAIIERTLSELISPQLLAGYDIWVICNGCTDNTENIVREKFPEVNCHSLTQASKALAIRFAESLNPGYPRLYLDADIELSSFNALGLLSLMRSQPQASLLVPSSTVQMQHSSTLVQRYYKAWYLTPYVKNLGFGCGTYMLDKKGRSRFGEWPELIADDAFVRSHFEPKDILIAQQYSVGVVAPLNLWQLIKIKTRSKLGNMELGKVSLVKRKQDKSNKNRPLLTLITHQDIHFFDALTYIIVNSVAVCLAKWKVFTGNRQWLRDTSAR